jgi:hypothetical protein
MAAVVLDNVLLAVTKVGFLQFASMGCYFDVNAEVRGWSLLG